MKHSLCATKLAGGERAGAHAQRHGAILAGGPPIALRLCACDRSTCMFCKRYCRVLFVRRPCCNDSMLVVAARFWSASGSRPYQFDGAGPCTGTSKTPTLKPTCFVAQVAFREAAAFHWNRKMGPETGELVRKSVVWGFQLFVC